MLAHSFLFNRINPLIQQKYAKMVVNPSVANRWRRWRTTRNVAGTFLRFGVCRSDRSTRPQVKWRYLTVRLRRLCGVVRSGLVVVGWCGVLFQSFRYRRFGTSLIDGCANASSRGIGNKYTSRSVRQFSRFCPFLRGCAGCTGGRIYTGGKARCGSASAHTQICTLVLASPPWFG